MGLSWVACESRTGRLIERLPGLACRKVGVTLCRYEAAEGLSLPLPDAPPSWVRATEPMASFLVLVDDEAPQWGGMIDDAPQVAELDYVPIAAATIEAYFARCYVGDRDFEGVGQNLIAKALIEEFVATGPNGGIPIRVEVVGGDGEPRDRHYKDSANQTVYSQLQELAGVTGGPEWTVGWERSVVDGEVYYTPVFYVGDRIGSSPADGLAPAATYRMPGPLRSFRRGRGWKTGKGANHVVAYSSGTGDSVPSASHTVADPDRPTVAFRFTPSTNITESDTLDAHAQRKAADLSRGERAISMVADYESSPKFGVDWFIGDDIGYSVGGTVSGPRQVVVTGDAVTEWAEETAGAAAVTTETQSWESVPAFPGGARGIERALGWRLNLDGVPTIEPILAGGES